MKNLRIEPIGTDIDVLTRANVISVLLAQAEGRVKAVCGGKGLCATCHIRVVEGDQSLSPLTPREKSTLALITGTSAQSRLACQAKILADGAVVEVPKGMYLESLASLESLIGRRAEEPIIHPVTGIELIPVGKIITRSIIMSLQNVEADLTEMLQSSERVV